MATLKINSVSKRVINIDVTWDDGLAKAGLEVPDCPVEDFTQTYGYLHAYITGIYQQVKAEADAAKGPTIDPQILAAVGHTFDDTGAVIG